MDSAGEPPLGAIYEELDNAHVCIAVEEYGQAVECFTRALSLIPPSSAWRSGATSPTASCDPIHALSTTLTLERADCLLRLRQFKAALEDTEAVLVMATRNLKAKRIKCEALLALDQERTALQIWTDMLIESGDSRETDLLKQEYPIQAVHVIHTMRATQPSSFPDSSASPKPMTLVRATPAVVSDKEAHDENISPFLSLGTAMLSQAHSTCLGRSRVAGPAKPVDADKHSEGSNAFFAQVPTIPVSGRHPREPKEQPSAACVPVDHVFSNLSTGTNSPPTASKAIKMTGFKETQRSTSTVLDRSFESSQPLVREEFTPTNASTHSLATTTLAPPPQKPRFVKAEVAQKLQLAMDCIPRKDFVSALKYIDEVMAMKRMPSLLYERALCIEALPSFLAHDKVAAFGEYVAHNPLDSEWVPHALYMMCSHYLDGHEYADAARMFFLADECEHLREQRAKFPPIDGVNEFPKKGEVGSAFTPPWLVVSSEEQRRYVQNGAFKCGSCPPGAELVPLMQYIEHRMEKCPRLSIRTARTAKTQQ